MLKLLTLLGALVVVALSAPAVNKGGWVLGKIGLSCNTVCASASAPCLRRSLHSVSNQALYNSVANRFTQILKGAASPNSPLYAPAWNSASKYGYFDRVGRATCGAIPPPKVRRLCCCSSTPCGPDFIDCVVSEWTPFGACSLTCGGGTKTHTRVVTKQPTANGEQCSDLTETVACNTFECPVDCVQSAWAGWGACSASCGTGEETRTRTTEVGAAFGGVACGELSETQDCNTFECPVDCVQSAWAGWGACSSSCGTGEETRTRTTEMGAAFGGVACGELSETQDCNTFECPIDCVHSAWAGWGACSSSCGTGEETRTRTTEMEAAFGGVACGELSETQDCNEIECPMDCVHSAWVESGSCSSSCGTGEQTWTRTTEMEAAFGGIACGELSQTQDCNTFECPIDCITSVWTLYSECSVTCGDGVQSRSRTTEVEAAFGGVACGALTQTRDCNDADCPSCSSNVVNSRPLDCNCATNSICQSNSCVGGKCVSA